MPKIESTGRADVSGSMTVTKDDTENSKWCHWQVQPASVEKQMPEVISPSRSATESGVNQKKRKMSLDSGIGSIASTGVIDIKRTDAELIGKGLERIYEGLFAGGARKQNLPEARQALQRSRSEDLLEVMAGYGLQHYAEGVLRTASQVLDWCVDTQPPKHPKDLVQARKHSDKLRTDSIKIGHMVSKIDKPVLVKKAIGQIALWKNKELIDYNKKKLEPARTEFDRVLYNQIDKHPSYQELQSCFHSIIALLPEDIEVSAPIDSTVRTWAYNVLLERARAAAGID